VSCAHAAFEAMVEVLHDGWLDAGPLTGSFVMAAAAFCRGVAGAVLGGFADALSSYASR
jgi:dTDP-4-amino-4,6-dideoxygalactose transaminase